MKTMKKSPIIKRFKKQVAGPSAEAQTERDFKDAILMVSVFVNLFMLCLWVALQTTSQYDSALVDFFINR